MRTGDLASAAAKMNLALKTLRLHWERTRADWNDGTSGAFEKSHLSSLEPEISTTLAAVGRVVEVLERARQECADNNI